MNYSINLYLKNKKKFQTINQLLSEIEETNRERNKFNSEVDSMRSKLFRDFAGKTIKTHVQYNSREIVIGKHGFGLLNDYERRAKFRESISDERFLDFLRSHRLEFNRLKSYIKRADKKEVVSIFVRNALEEKKTVREMSMKVGKTIIDPDNMKPVRITAIRASIDYRDGTDIDMKAMTENKGSMSLSSDDSIQENMIKEQLYLPIWKLLVKAKRHALKQRRIAEKRFASMKKQLEPFWFADKLAEVSA